MDRKNNLAFAECHFLKYNVKPRRFSETYGVLSKKSSTLFGSLSIFNTFEVKFRSKTQKLYNIMKKLLIILLFTLYSSIIYSQTTRYWTGAANNELNNSSNWTSTGSILATDILVFQDIINSGIYITGDIACSGFKLEGYTNISINVSSSSTIFINDDGTASPDFYIGISTSVGNSNMLSLSGDVLISLQGTATGEVNGTINMQGPQCQITCSTYEGLVFTSNGWFSQTNANLTFPFGNDPLKQNTVVFEDMAIFVQSSAFFSPFALTPPASVVVFRPASQFVIDNSGYNDFLGRSYGKIEIRGTVTINADLTNKDYLDNTFSFYRIVCDGNFAVDISNNTPPSQIVINGTDITIPGIGTVSLTTGSGGFKINSDNCELGRVNTSGMLIMTVIDSDNTFTQPFVETGKNVTLSSNVYLSSTPMYEKIYVDGTLECNNYSILGTGVIELRDGSLFKTANINGLIGSHPNFSLSTQASPLFTTNTTIEYNGSVAQLTGIYDGTFEVAGYFGNIIINNPAGVTLDGNLTLMQTLELQNGNFDISSRTLEFKDAMANYNLGSYQIITNNLTSINISNIGTFTLPDIYELQNLNITGSEVYMNQNLTINNSLSLISSTLNLNNKKLTYSGVLDYDVNSTIVGSYLSELELTGISLVTDKLRTIELGTLIYNRNSSNLNLLDYDNDPLTYGQIYIHNSLQILSGTVNIGEQELVLGGDLTLLGGLTSTANSRLKITGTTKPPSLDFPLSLKTLKSLEIDRTGTTVFLNSYDEIIEINNLIINNSNLDYFNNRLKLTGYIEMNNSLLSTSSWSFPYGLVWITGNYSQDCSIAFSEDNNFFDVYIDRPGGNIHLGSNVRSSGFTLEHGKVFLGDYDIDLATSEFIDNSSGFDENTYLVTNGTGRLWHDANGAKGTYLFPVGTENYYSPVEFTDDEGIQIYWGVRVSETVPAIVDNSYWINQTWNIYVEDEYDSVPEYTVKLFWDGDLHNTPSNPNFNPDSCFITTATDEALWDLFYTSKALLDGATGLYTQTRIIDNYNSDNYFSVRTCKASSPTTSITVDNQIYCENEVKYINLSYPESDKGNCAEAYWYDENSNNIWVGNNLTIPAPSASTFFAVSLSDGFNTPTTASVDITVNPNPTATLTSTDTDLNICNGETITLEGTGGVNYEFYANGNLLTSGVASSLITDLNGISSNIQLVVENEYNCSDTAYLDVNVYPAPVIDLENTVTINEGESYTLNANGNTDYSYFWTPNTWIDSQTIYNPTVTPEDTITYYAEITDNYGCKSEYKVSISIVKEDVPVITYQIEIYDAVSPNNDGKNDYFYIKNIEHFAGNSVEVFDRNGNSVFYADSYNNNWSGTNDKTGDLLPFGTYFYVIDLKNGMPVFRGTFMIFR